MWSEVVRFSLGQHWGPQPLYYKKFKYQKKHSFSWPVPFPQNSPGISRFSEHLLEGFWVLTVRRNGAGVGDSPQQAGFHLAPRCYCAHPRPRLHSVPDTGPSLAFRPHWERCV